MSVHWTARSRFLLFAAVALLLYNLGRQGYRWVAYAEEREVLRRLTESVDTVALEVMRSQIAADSLRAVIEAADSELREEREALAALERRAEDNRLPPTLYDEYRSVLARYNQHVGERNAVYERWRGVVSRNHAAVERYNAIADSIRTVGAKMGEPYIPIPSPSEVAVEHGLTPR
ncbi:MAG TPA: hypothetical protein VF167_10065 [Longimicrobiaceae bacterium]